MEKLLAKALGQDEASLSTQQKQVLLSRLLARLAHEIRNPLSSLDIHVQLLEEDLAEISSLPPKTMGRLEIIRTELHRLEAIVKQFLSLSGPSALNLEKVNVSEAIGYVCDLLKPEAAERGISFQLKVQEGLPLISADPARLTQALVNLVINAIQAIERNGCITLSAKGNKDSLLLQVQDTGPGIPADRQSNIFDPFFTTKSDGTGLGLWIVQQIITAHGGTIQAENGPDGGALFAVQLPWQPKLLEHG